MFWAFEAQALRELAATVSSGSQLLYEKSKTLRMPCFEEAQVEKPQGGAPRHQKSE